MRCQTEAERREQGLAVAACTATERQSWWAEDRATGKLFRKEGWSAGGEKLSSQWDCCRGGDGKNCWERTAPRQPKQRKAGAELQQGSKARASSRHLYLALLSYCKYTVKFRPSGNRKRNTKPSHPPANEEKCKR